MEWISANFFFTPKRLSPVRGKRYYRVASSKFCPSKMIELYHKALDLESCMTVAKRRRVDCLSESERIKPLSELLESSEILRKMCSIYPDIKADTKVVCCGDFHSILTDGAAFRDYLKGLQSALGQLRRGDHLILRGAPLLRRLDVAVLHIASRCFEEVGFVRYQNGRSFPERLFPTHFILFSGPEGTSAPYSSPISREMPSKRQGTFQRR